MRQYYCYKIIIESRQILLDRMYARQELVFQGHANDLFFGRLLWKDSTFKGTDK